MGGGGEIKHIDFNDKNIYRYIDFLVKNSKLIFIDGRRRRVRRRRRRGSTKLMHFENFIDEINV